VVVIGAGAEGRAVVRALLDLGIGKIIISDPDSAVLANTLARCQSMQLYLETKAASGGDKGIKTVLESSGDLSATFATAGICGLVNASGAGERGLRGDKNPLSPEQLAALPPTCWVLDCAYAAEPAGTKTELLLKAAERGLVACNGGKMALGSILRKLELMTEMKPDMKKTEAILLAQLALLDSERNDPRVQDMELPLPTLGGVTGDENYLKLQQEWLAGERVKGEALTVPDDQDDSMKLLVIDKPTGRSLKNAVPLQSLMDKLCDQWIEDKTM